MYFHGDGEIWPRGEVAGWGECSKEERTVV